MRISNIIAALSFILVISTASAFKNEPDGFRGIKWGTHINDVSEKFMPMSEENSVGSIRYNRPLEPHKIGEAELSTIIYEFIKDRFCAVHIVSTDLENGVKLFNRLKAVFGPVTDLKETGDFTMKIWWGEDIQVTHHCITVSDQPRCEVTMLSMKYYFGTRN